MKLQILDDAADSDTSDGENVDNASIDSDPDGSFEAGIACAQDMITDALSQMRRTRTVPHRDALVAMASTLRQECARLRAVHATGRPLTTALRQEALDAMCDAEWLLVRVFAIRTTRVVRYSLKHIMHQDYAYAIRPKRSPARGLWPPGGRALIDDATNAADNE